MILKKRKKRRFIQIPYSTTPQQCDIIKLSSPKAERVLLLRYLVVVNFRLPAINLEG